jgi:hypothetical protein
MGKSRNVIRKGSGRLSLRRSLLRNDSNTAIITLSTA